MSLKGLQIDGLFPFCILYCFDYAFNAVFYTPRLPGPSTWHDCVIASSSISSCASALNTAWQTTNSLYPPERCGQTKGRDRDSRMAPRQLVFKSQIHSELKCHRQSFPCPSSSATRHEFDRSPSPVMRGGPSSDVEAGLFPFQYSLEAGPRLNSPKNLLSLTCGW